MEEWERQKAIQLNKEHAELLDLAFSTFFLNRTNRSGIIKYITSFEEKEFLSAELGFLFLSS